MPDPLPSVVITGTSTGIGRATALRLDAEGHRVFAGVRCEDDGEALRRDASDRLTPIPLDVTDTGAIEVAVKSVEARGSGISVSVVEPGFIETPMLDKAKAITAEAIEKLPPRGRELYENALRKYDATTEAFRKRAATPDAVAKAIQHALTAPRPKTRYTVGLDSKALSFLGWVLPDRARDAITGYLLGL